MTDPRYRATEPTTKVRIFETDKDRFDELSSQLTIESGGTALTSAQVIRVLLDTYEAHQNQPDEPHIEHAPKEDARCPE